jgi:hypothetical protein
MLRHGLFPSSPKGAQVPSFAPALPPIYAIPGDNASLPVTQKEDCNLVLFKVLRK